MYDFNLTYSCLRLGCITRTYLQVLINLSSIEYSRYIKAEQQNTRYDLNKKLKRYDEPKNNDVVVTFDGNKITNQSFEFFNMLQQMLEDSGQPGELEYDIFKINVKKLVDYKETLINIK